jgi:hypothetical protein
LVVVVLSVLVVTKYLYAESVFGSVVSGDDELTLKISNLARLSAYLGTYLRTGECCFIIKNICLICFLLILALWRSWLLKKAWK